MIPIHTFSQTIRKGRSSNMSVDFQNEDEALSGVIEYSYTKPTVKERHKTRTVLTEASHFEWFKC